MEKLYFSDSIEYSKGKKLAHLARSGCLPAGYFAIYKSDKEDELMAAYSHADNNRKYFQDKGLKLLGVANNRSSAKRLMTKIIEDMYNESSNFDVESFFEE